MRDEDKSVGRADNQRALACALGLAAVAGALGCGARSTLPDLDAPPAQPAHTGICTQPTPVELPESLSFHARRPAFTRLARSTEVAAVYGLDTPGSNDLTAVPVGDVVFDPWGAWPPDWKGPFRISDAGGASFAVDVGDTQGFVLFGGFLASSGACGVMMGYGEDLDPTAPGLLGWGNDGCPGDAQPALFMATNLHAFPGDSYAFLMGYDALWGGTHHRLDLRDQGAASAGETPLCTKGPMVADGVPWEEGFLIAASGDMTAPDMDFCPDSMESDPAILSLRLHTPTPPPQMAGASLKLGSFGNPLSRVRLSRRGDGAWVFHQTRDPSGATSPIRAQRILVTGGSQDGQLDAAAAPLDIVPAGRSGFAAAPLGDGFALAWVEPGAAIGVAVFDDAGHEIGSTTVPGAPGATIEGPVTVLASPDASALLVGWSETPPQQVARVKVVRFDCLGNKGL
jgi:hypothetical protein